MVWMLSASCFRMLSASCFRMLSASGFYHRSAEMEVKLAKPVVDLFTKSAFV